MFTGDMRHNTRWESAWSNKGSLVTFGLGVWIRAWHITFFLFTFFSVGGADLQARHLCRLYHQVTNTLVPPSETMCIYNNVTVPFCTNSHVIICDIQYNVFSIFINLNYEWQGSFLWQPSCWLSVCSRVNCPS